MGKIYLCGHTGSVNRGCEAILRSTAGLLKACGNKEVRILTMDEGYDRFLGLDRIGELIPYPRKPFPVRVLSVLRRKILGDGVWGARYVHRSLFRQAKREDILFNVGGDTYCYGTPNLSYAMNEMGREQGIPTVFWGCSVDERALSDSRMQADINRYAYIVTRETITCEYMKQIVKDPDRVLLACDPAFWLEMEETRLPEGFIPGNTVGINISPLVMGRGESEDDIMYKNVHALIARILNDTDMSVCLIPHVYDPEKGTEDIRILRRIYRYYKENPRVMLVEEALPCTQLKYIISRCRFFVGARTHSVIAAYSTGVPALAISYSVKSVGIARDLLGDEARFTVDWKKLRDSSELYQRVWDLMEHEEEVRCRYAQVLPEYKKTIKTALNKIFSEI